MTKEEKVQKSPAVVSLENAISSLKQAIHVSTNMSDEEIDKFEITEELSASVEEKVANNEPLAGDEVAARLITMLRDTQEKLKKAIEE